MNQADNRILECLESSDLVLSPKVISYNIDYTRNYVSQRLKKLVTAGMVEKVDDGMYEITEFGQDYLYGELEVEDIDLDDL
jgi:predicted transcriptional regulator